MVPKEFRKTLCVFAGCITLVEGVLWLAACVYTIGVFNCSWDFVDMEKGVSTWSMLYLSYFMGGCRGEAGAHALGYFVTPPTNASRNLQVYLWIFTVLSAVWIPACLLLLVAAVAEVRGSKGSLLYHPWTGLTATLCIMDLAAFIYHACDIYSNNSPDSFAQFVGAKSWSALTGSSASAGVVPWLPSLYVSLFFCRLLVLWLLNIFLVYSVYKAGNAVSLYKVKYIKTSLMTQEKNKSWKDKFYEGPDPSVLDQQPQGITTIGQVVSQDLASRTPSSVKIESPQAAGVKTKHFPSRYKTDEFGIPIEEMRSSESRDHQVQSEDVRPAHQVSGRLRSDGDWSPPIASGVQVPPELNKFEPFSYMAGDQPQLMKRPVSRSNSKAEYPSIPRPDYTIADRHPNALEYVPNRFKVPSPKRPVSYPASPKVAPAPPKKPQAHPRSALAMNEDPAAGSPARYLSQQALPIQQEGFYTRQASQNNEYNINSLY